MQSVEGHARVPAITGALRAFAQNASSMIGLPHKEVNMEAVGAKTSVAIRQLLLNMKELTSSRAVPYDLSRAKQVHPAWHHHDTRPYID